MRILVTYASKYGATQGIAERIAATLKSQGAQVELEPVSAVEDASEYDAFVIGGAAYVGSWLKDATEFVRRNRDILDARPVWIFSSGPLGTDLKDPQGRDVLTAAEPKEFAEFAKTIRPREQRVFFGALAAAKLRGTHRLFSLVPASKKVLIEGDFREWAAIEDWARGIAHHLAATPVAR